MGPGLALSFKHVFRGIWSLVSPKSENFRVLATLALAVAVRSRCERNLKTGLAFQAEFGSRAPVAIYSDAAPTQKPGLVAL